LVEAFLEKRRPIMKVNQVFIAISILIFSFIPVFRVCGEVMYKGGKIPIPKFPAPKLPKTYEPPDWKDYPWFKWWKPETFDPNQPHAAEKIWWINKDNYDSGYVYEDLSALMDENRFGHVRALSGTRAAMYLSQPDFQDLLSYNEGKIKAGDLEFKQQIYMFEPAQIRGLTNLSYKYVETPAVKKEQDRWVYIPALRRTRRLAAGADDDKIAGTDFTVDDVGEREVWEEEHILIGEDVLTPEDYSFYQFTYKGYPREAFAVAPLPKGGISCWVVLSVNRKPKYYFPKRITWFDKKNLVFVREEQYDFNGNLWKIYETAWGYFDRYKVKSAHKYVNPKYGTGYVPYATPSLRNIWDLKINHRTLRASLTVLFDKDSFLNWAGGGPPPHSFFDVKRLEREEWGRPLPHAPRLKSPDEWLPPPKLLRGRFKPYRKIVLPEELEKKLLEEYGE